MRIVWIRVCIIFFMVFSLYPQQNEVTKYEVRVSVKIIPVFAVNDKGDPVLDLQKEDLELLVNGKKTPLIYLIKRELQAEEKKAAPAPAKTPFMTRTQARIVFILLDFRNNSSSGIRRMKDIAAKIIHSGKEYDRFVLIGMGSGSQSLFYIAGPESASEKLVKKIEYNDRKRNLSVAVIESGGSIDSDEPRQPIDPTLAWLGAPMGLEEGVVATFAQKIILLKQAFQLFIQPKVVYLISRGIPDSAFSEKGFPAHYDWLKAIAETVNEGGATLFTINPEGGGSGKPSLQIMAEESGGRYFEGRKVQEIVQDVQKTTAAYYEAVFSLEALEGVTEYKIKINCSRAGVRLFMPSILAENKKYPELSPFEKQLFAVDIIEAGLWSRMLSIVKRAEWESISPKMPTKGNQAIRIHIPQEMRYQTGNIYLIHLQRQKNDVQIENEMRNFQEYEVLQIEKKADEEIFFVLIINSGRFSIFGYLKK